MMINNSRHATPPEAVIIAAESPLRVGRLIDMFLSRNDFDPNFLDQKQKEFYSQFQERYTNTTLVSKEAREARERARQIVRRTNDISETLKKIRG
jgi:hypothetical protein